MPVATQSNGLELLTATHNASAHAANSNTLTASSASTASDGGRSSLDGAHPKLDFAKREVSDSQGRHSYSQLSSMTARSPDLAMAYQTNRRKHRQHSRRDKQGSTSKSRSSSTATAAEPYATGAAPAAGHAAAARAKSSAAAQGSAAARSNSHGGATRGDENGAAAAEEDDEEDDEEDEDDEEEQAIEPDHQERIRNPASSAFRKAEPRERIGFRQPFSDTEVDSTSSQESNVHTPGSSAQTSPTDFSTLNKPSSRRIKHYEPARVVINKSELGLDEPGVNHDSFSEPPSRSSSIVPLAQGGSPESRARGSVSYSMISSLVGSPDDSSICSTAPLKHLREPKQPIYIPAVLRPTDFASYHSPAGATKPSSDAPRKPITQHWVRDANAKKCRTCDRHFTWYRRRHHCRKCGGVFCSSDANHTIGLDRVLNFNILGMPCRACDVCAAEFTGFCLDAPRLRDGPASSQQPMQGPELEETEAGDGRDWSTF